VLGRVWVGKCGSHHNSPTLPPAGAGVAITPGAGPAAPPGAAAGGPETAPGAVGMLPRSDSTKAGGGGPGGPGAPPLGAFGTLLFVVTGTTFG
jgi:hypothetical protein